MPKNWQSFLRDDNKTELFHFLPDKIAEMPTMNVVVVTKEDWTMWLHVVTKGQIYVYLYMPSKQ